MSPSQLSDDNFYDSYIDPAAYEHSQNTALSVLGADSTHRSALSSPHCAPPIPHRVVHDAFHNHSVGLSRYGKANGPIYLVDQLGCEDELQTTDESSFAHEDIMFGAHSEPSIGDTHHSIYHFSRAELDWDPLFESQLPPDSPNQFGMSSILYDPPSTSLTSKVDSMHLETASTRGRHKHGSGIRPRRKGRSHASSPSSSTSEHVFGDLNFCYICDSSFTLPKDLNRHIKSIHNQESLLCPEQGCEQRFSRSDKLLQHRRSSHKPLVDTGESDVQSPISSVYGGSLGSEVSSTLIEDAEEDDDQDISTTRRLPLDSRKRLDCQFCDKTFNLQHDRLRHLRTLHRKQENSVYRCSIPSCVKRDKMFNRVDNFKKHLRITHGLEGLTETRETVLKSKTSSRDTFTIMTPDMYSCSQ